ncbi:peroxiredoxin family protein [Candidatus Bipolaricaulota sp. J31]
MALFLSSAQGFSQVICQGYECGLSLLFAVLPHEIALYEEGRVEVVEPPLPIPSFEGVDVLTERKITSEYLKGKLAFLIFVDIYNFDYIHYWPPPKLPPDVIAEERGYWTKRALSVLQKVHEAFADAGVAVLGVLRGPNGWTEERAKALAEELNISFPLIHDEGLWMELGVDTYSHLILVVDREGKIRFQGRWDDPIICGLGLDCPHLMRYLCPDFDKLGRFSEEAIP